LQNYNVQYSIGHGGFGNVYKAEHRFTGQKVAIKFIEKKKIQNHSGMMKRVLQEVAIHSRLKHPSILEVYNYFEDAHYIYLILELCPHGDLNSKLKTLSCGFPEHEVRSYMQQIVDGIVYLQKHRILHRDLTLSNILISRHGTVKIADFGLATQLQDVNEKHFTMCGTPNYISPEVASRTSHGLESDVWSVGCMFYAMLTGKPPFDGEGVKETLERIKSGEYCMPDHVSSHAKHLIKSLLQMKPEDRLKLER
ncbi:hypothetical protein HELRODRAFT_80994, partial [Helobdella robusta]|uniref:Protein kinase domain-containing protein n=1 Tax=Helobdella robusta TaxID=6412 RepID=T1G479_HELRO